MIPGAGTIVGGAISASTAAALTLALGLAYIESLKYYLKRKLEGHEIPLSELAKIILEQYKFYARTGHKTLKEGGWGVRFDIDFSRWREKSAAPPAPSAPPAPPASPALPIYYV
ncbi:hypothetical protein [Coleofasciculus chthonoplastes]|uniref:hypothetical protein n=1 Tax=Coleofasciculus chthonoplastes TaxID=64178 RepID=UPI0032F13313